MDRTRERHLARAPYNWLRISPLLTITTLLIVISADLGSTLCGTSSNLCSYDVSTLITSLSAVLISALWHLVLLQYLNIKYSEIIHKHGRQALIYAGIRTAIPVIAIAIDFLIDSGNALTCLIVPVMITLWVVNPNSGLKQVEADLPKEEPALEQKISTITPTGNREEILQKILGELRAEDDVVVLTAIMKLNSMKDSNEAIFKELEALADEDENMDIRMDARVALNNLKNQNASPSISPLQFDSEKSVNPQKGTPEEVLGKILIGLKSLISNEQLQAIIATQTISYSSEAIRNELEKLALNSNDQRVRAGALTALDLSTQRNVRSRFNIVDRANRTILLHEINEWEKTGLLTKQNADVIRKRYDFDIAPLPPQPKPAPVQPAALTRAAPPPAMPKPAVPESVKQAAPVAIQSPAPQPKPVIKVQQPVEPPKPKKPPVDWRQVITEAVTSGALLRALLYLGAFMIVISATVLVIRFWDQFNPILKLVFISSIPLLFYAGGWVVRTRLKLVQAGTVLTGIGAILVAVDFGAIYQLGVIDRAIGPVYWFIVSIFCTALYVFTARRLKGEFFDYLTLLGGTGILFTFTRLLSILFTITNMFKIDIEWSVASVTLSGAAMTVLAGYLSKRGGEGLTLGRAARFLSQFLIPFSIIFLLFSWADLPTMLAFLFATIGYCVLAWQFPKIVFAYTALGASIGVVIFAFRASNLSGEWYATVGAVLALVYILIGQHIKNAKAESTIIQNYVKALNTTAFILITLAALGGVVVSLEKIWAGVIAMTIASIDLAICAYFFGKSRYTLLSVGLFIVPFTIAIGKWLNDAHTLQALTWLTVAWGALALIYILTAAFLQKVSDHARWLYVWAHGLIPIALFFIWFDYLSSDVWVNTSALISLGVCTLGYVVTFILQDSGKHASLSAISNWLPFGLGKAIFLWPIGVLLPILTSAAWHGTELPREWLGTTIAGFALAYLAVGQTLFKRTKEYRFPFHVLVYLLCLTAIPTSAPNQYALLITTLITCTAAGILAYLYNRVIETIIASVLFIWPFQIALDLFKIDSYSRTLGYVLLGSLVYIPAAIYLNKFEKSREKFHHLPVFVMGYLLAAFAVLASVFNRETTIYIPWVGVTVPLIATILFTFSTAYFKTSKFTFGWAWASVLTFAIAFGQALTLFKVPAQFDSLAWVGLAVFYMLTERALFFVSQPEKNEVQKFWSGMYFWPLAVFTLMTALLGFALSLPNTLNAFMGVQVENQLAFILAQVLLVLLAITSARLYQKRWPLFIEPFLAFLPVTLFFITYGESIFAQPLTTQQYAFAWTGLGIVHFIAAIFLDRSKARYSHGIYLGAYALLSWAVLWSLIDNAVLVWTFGLWILTLIASAILVHFRKHITWDEYVLALFGKSASGMQTVARNIFQWLSAWSFPVWCVIFLYEIKISENFHWLGLTVPPLAYLGLALWLRRIDPAYAAPLRSAAQFYTAIGLLISAPTTVNFLAGNPLESKLKLLAFVILQSTAVIFYASSAWVFKSRGFAHASAWLSILPFTLAWKLFGPTFTSIPLVIPWLIWSTALLLIGFLLDKNKTRYAHGPYLAGYALAVYALICSTSDRLTNIYALAITISLALISHLVLHFGRHLSFEDFINRFWKNTDPTTQSIASTVFLFFTAYALPVLLTQTLAYNKFDLAFRGVILALVAPLYIAAGLWMRRFTPKSTLTLVPTWAVYSAGYILTAIAAMVSFGDERLATYVLALNALVYAASAYIFQQTFWLYLSNILIPVIALLILHQTKRFESTWVSWTFMGIAYLYLGIGQLFDRRRKLTENAPDIHPFAAPFYFPGFFISAIALAAASGERNLAIQIYSMGVIYYALCGFIFREALFIYPAAWLATVPYFLAVTLTPLEVRWYGLAWLPLIVLYIGLGRFVFHKRPLVQLGQGLLGRWLSHPAIPFYLVAYGLSISMISLSYVSPLALTLAFAAGAIIYAASAFLFRTPGWFYPALFALHMTLLASFTIHPQGGKAYYLSIPFLAATWLTSLLGLGFSRWIPESGQTSEKEAYPLSLLNRLLGNSWSRPFFIFAAIEMVIWQSVALNGYDTTIITGIGHALLLALFALLWMEGLLVYGVVGFGLLAAGAALKQAQVPFADAVAIFGGIGLGLYLLGRIFESISTRIKTLSVWLAPLTHSAIFLTAAAVIVDLPLVVNHMTSTAGTLAFAGALYVSIAYRERKYAFGYFGMALLEIAWTLAIYMSDIKQPQLYAIPAGLYFLGISYFELRRNKKTYSVALEILGLGILLLTSFTQSLNGENGLPYFVLMLAESFLIIWWGTLQKRRIPFLTGIGAIVLNVIAQTILLIQVHDINRWYVIFGVGLLIMGLAIGIERGREQLRAYSREWSERLETWE